MTRSAMPLSSSDATCLTVSRSVNENSRSLARRVGANQPPLLQVAQMVVGDRRVEASNVARGVGPAAPLTGTTSLMRRLMTGGESQARSAGPRSDTMSRMLLARRYRRHQDAARPVRAGRARGRGRSHVDEFVTLDHDGLEAILERVPARARRVAPASSRPRRSAWPARSPTRSPSSPTCRGASTRRR